MWAFDQWRGTSLEGKRLKTKGEQRVCRKKVEMGRKGDLVTS